MKIIKIGWGAFYYVNFWHEEYSVLDFTNEGFHEIEFHSKRGKQKIEVNFDIDFAPDYALAVQVRKFLIFNQLTYRQNIFGFCVGLVWVIFNFLNLILGSQSFDFSAIFSLTFVSKGGKGYNS